MEVFLLGLFWIISGILLFILISWIDFYFIQNTQKCIIKLSDLLFSIIMGPTIIILVITFLLEEIKDKELVLFKRNKNN